MRKAIILFFAAVSLVVAEPMRTLDLQGAPNFRDIGRYATTDRRHVKWHQVYRSSDLARLTAADAEVFEDLHLRSVVDLRTQDERRRAPDVRLHQFFFPDAGSI
jgi:protein-tyrosine phosphatase